MEFFIVSPESPWSKFSQIEKNLKEAQWMVSYLEDNARKIQMFMPLLLNKAALLEECAHHKSLERCCEFIKAAIEYCVKRSIAQLIFQLGSREYPNIDVETLLSRLHEVFLQAEMLDGRIERVKSLTTKVREKTHNYATSVPE
jgi:hypothetical protein